MRAVLSIVVVAVLAQYVRACARTTMPTSVSTDTADERFIRRGVV